MGFDSYVGVLQAIGAQAFYFHEVGKLEVQLGVRWGISTDSLPGALGEANPPKFVDE